MNARAFKGTSFNAIAMPRDCGMTNRAGASDESGESPFGPRESMRCRANANAK
jgi:hypothetical protein